MKRKVLLTSILTIVLCLCLISGSTYAVFSDSSEVKVIASSARVQVNAQISGFTAQSLGNDCEQNSSIKYTFANGGTAELVGSQLKLTNMTPGDSVTVTVSVSNTSNIKTNCNVSTTYSSTSSPSLGDALVLTDGAGNPFNGSIALASGADHTFTLTIELPKTTGDTYQGKNATVTITVSATQAHG